LSRFRGGRAVILAFFPLALTPTCTAEVGDLRDAASFDGDVAILGVTVDSSAVLRAWAERERIDFPLLSDFWPHGAVARMYEAFDGRSGRPTRVSYLIDALGVIRASVTSAPGTARSISDYREAVRAAEAQLNRAATPPSR